MLTKSPPMTYLTGPNIFIQLTSPLGNPQLGQVPLSRAATRAAGPGRRRARQRMVGETYSDRRCGDLERNLGRKWNLISRFCWFVWRRWIRNADFQQDHLASSKKSRDLSEIKWLKWNLSRRHENTTNILIHINVERVLRLTRMVLWPADSFDQQRCCSKTTGEVSS